MVESEEVDFSGALTYPFASSKNKYFRAISMKHWKSAILGMSCFLLICWYFTSIVLSYEGEVLIVNLATEPVKNGELEVCDQKFQFGGIDQGKSKLLLSI